MTETIVTQIFLKCSRSDGGKAPEKQEKVERNRAKVAELRESKQI